MNEEMTVHWLPLILAASIVGATVLGLFLKELWEALWRRRVSP